MEKEKRQHPGEGHLFGTVNKAVRRGSFSSHRHPMAELYICLGGSATDTIDRRERHVGTGDIFVHTAEGVHTQRNLTEFRCLVLQFHMERLSSRAEALGIAETEGFRALFGGGDEPLCLDAATLHISEHLGDMMREEEDPLVLDSLFLTLVSLLSVKCQRRDAPPPPKEDDPINRLIAYIGEHYREELTLSHLASMTHYSGRHMTRLFRERTGDSPMAYLDTVRTRAAAALLLRTRENVAAIGRKCGFPDHNLFSRHFRLSYGLSPSEYRRRHGAPPSPTLSGVFEMRDPKED